MSGNERWNRIGYYKRTSPVASSRSISLVSLVAIAPSPRGIPLYVKVYMNRLGGKHVVSCTHRHTDAGLFTSGHGLLNTFSERVLDASNANKREDR